jgi:hypothetical protein
MNVREHISRVFVCALVRVYVCKERGGGIWNEKLCVCA